MSYILDDMICLNILYYIRYYIIYYSMLYNFGSQPPPPTSTQQQRYEFLWFLRYYVKNAMNSYGVYVIMLKTLWIPMVFSILKYCTIKYEYFMLCDDINSL